MTSLPPLGCLPAARTLFGAHQSGCVSYINTNAQEFNKKVNSAASQLQKNLPGLKIVIFDIFKPLYDVIKSPSNYGWYTMQILISEQIVSLIDVRELKPLFFFFLLYVCVCRVYRSSKRVLWNRDSGDNRVFVQS